ncbi:hypothetical protein ACHAWF_003780 [Thalassiosira exigua]
MTASLRILTASSLDSNPSLVIVSPDGSKTLINCGEGCQRSFLESAGVAAGPGIGNLRLSSVNRVCLTHVGHGALGGLPGLILTTADVAEAVAKDVLNAKGKGGRNGGAPVGGSGSIDGNGRRKRPLDDRDRPRSGGGLTSNDDEGGLPDLEIVGPEGTGAFLRSLRHFMRRDKFKVRAHEGRYDSSRNDRGASASFAAKKAKKKGKGGKGGGGGSGVGSDDFGFRVESVPITYEVDKDDGPNRAPMKKQAVSYLFTTPSIPGKFLVDKARALNVPKGPLYGRLKAGKSVTFVDPTTGEERTVASEEVVAEPSPGAGVAVIYCPTLRALDALREADPLRSCAKASGKGGASDEERAGFDVVVHMTPKSVFDEPAYRSWCERFGSSIDHIALHSAESLEVRAGEEGNSPFFSGMCGGMRRSFVHDRLFPTPVLTTERAEEGIPGRANCGLDELSTIDGVPLMEYVLLPSSRRGLNPSSTKGLYAKQRINQLREQVSESGAIEAASSIVSSCARTANNSDPGGNAGLGELIFTGTGSAVPCKHRNVTGMYLRMNNGNSMLLDVGEGTIGQLLRSWKSTLSSDRAPIDEYRSRLRGIKAVWISHPHADHHLGLLRLLSERTAICGANDPVVLMAPHDMFDFLSEYGSIAPEIDRSYVAVDCYAMIHGRPNPQGKRLFDELGITRCVSVPVAHCRRSYAVVIDGTSFGRVAYSGDCRPSNRFADVASGADLLIHEATFEDGMEEDAVLKRHSTVGEAIEVASKMNARSLVLTHFSQRYPKIPPLNRTREQERAKEIPIVFAFDFMILTPKTINLAASLTSALRLLYPREGVDEEEMVTGKMTAKDLMAVPGIFAAKGVL